MTAFDNFADMPRKHYGVVYADPAWTFKTFGPQDQNRYRRDAGKHYKTMSTDQIKALPVRDVAARDCLLMLWTTWPHLPQALEVMHAWGFKYSSSFKVWAKLKKGFSPTRAFVTNPNDFFVSTGYTSRKNTEPCLLGRRGSPARLAADVRELMVSPVREHSRKPDEMYGEIERYANGPYLELNARTERPGWDQWGDEIAKFLHPPEILTKPGCEPEEQGLFDRLRPRFTVLPGVDEPDIDRAEAPAFLRSLAGG